MFSTRPGLRVPVQSANQDDPMNGNGPAELTSQIVHCALTPQLLGRRQANLSLGLRGGATGQSRRENNTGTEFPSAYCHLSKSDCPSLVGIGSRRKRLLGLKAIDVYALGLYVDEKATKSLLSGKSKSEDKLCQDVLEASDLEKTIRIVVTSKMVNYDKFISGLKESLEPACKKTGDTDSMPEFEKLFDGTDFRKGLELAFTSTKQGALAARIDNRDVGEVPSKAFTDAFFSLYLGESPVSPDAKKSFGQGLVNLASQASELETGAGN